MEKWQLETAERLASIERSIKYIEANLSNPPVSAQCVTSHKELEDRMNKLEEFRTYILVRVAWVSGAFAVILSAIPYAWNWLASHISLKLG